MQDFDYAIDEADVQVPCGLTFAGMTPRGCFAGGSALSGPAADIGRQAGRLKSLLTADHLGKGTAVAWLSLQPGDGDISRADRCEPVSIHAALPTQHIAKSSSLQACATRAARIPPIRSPQARIAASASCELPREIRRKLS